MGVSRSVLLKSEELDKPHFFFFPDEKSSYDISYKEATLSSFIMDP